MNNLLSSEDKSIIAVNEIELKKVIDRIEHVRQFKLNDYLIRTLRHLDNGHRELVTNSYGTPMKYKVVHVDSCGVPYVKEIGSNGKTRGRLLPLMGVEEYDQWGNVINSSDIEWAHDPHFVESIILSAEESYDPTEIQRRKKTLRNEITKHNLGSKVKSEVPELVAAFDLMQVGQMYWFSTKSGMTIDKITTVKVARNRNDMPWHMYRKFKTVNQIEVTLSNGKKGTFLPHHFAYRNLYIQQPRSYKELSDTI